MYLVVYAIWPPRDLDVGDFESEAQEAAVKPGTKNQVSHREAAHLAAMVKAHVPVVANKILYQCVQFHGGMGYMTETPVERISRDVRLMAIGGGATEVMLQEVAKRI